MLRQTGIALFALAGLAACAPSVPDSAAGVTSNSYRSAREAQLQGAIPTAPVVSSETLTPGAPARARTLAEVRASAELAIDSTEAQNTARLAAANSGAVPLQASPSNPAPELATGSTAGISSENDFKAVSTERTIQDDKALIERNRSLYTVIQPEALPTRPDGSVNVVAYALATNNRVGQQLYKRSSFRAEAKYARACAEYASPDLAQAAFLAKGGPDKDKLGVDPDGDGFACTWDPQPFRNAVR
ncbi:hypothetical protein HJ526_07045 [Donghicola sp. C2-DW-16]|uniref:Excalibur calcium-binding domain-containing protein n=1 Tax=Donghicola mangrovi TaxID=2729614 RepID=A0A850QA69_9RHOB|nr:hypothetical protein [Donghicola mangrovi]NVO23375.1 hypothetical protein [Donghicola mangrovi]NVO27167.1 hypothetical protein [Donghicola mangrovi]